MRSDQPASTVSQSSAAVASTELELPLRERMQCMEIWGGNRAINQNFEAPGLDIHVHSTPYLDSQTGGGDIYYLTSCASGRISRFLLADISGHGAAVSNMAVKLRDLLRENVNKISQQQFVARMNREFGAAFGDSGFATAVVATFFEPRKSLSISVAGHPFPIYYRASKRQWVHLDPAGEDGGLQNLPLGVHEDSSYPERIIFTETGDMFLLYSDAFIESVNGEDQLLGVRGMLDLLNEIENPEPGKVIDFLRRKIGSISAGNLVNDDATLILGCFTSTRVRLRDNLLAPFRLLGDVGDSTQLGE